LNWAQAASLRQRGVIYHTNSEELRDHYIKIFEEAGITNFQFKITK